MTTIREDAGAPSGSVPPDDRSLVPSIRGLRWWATLLIALVLTVAGVAADILRIGQLGLLYTICFPVGCVLAAVWARRSELFGPMVQPPLVLAVTVPVVVVATGSLPSSGGTVSTMIAIGGPLINGFPAMAVTTAVCLAIGFVRWRVQPSARPGSTGSAGPSRPDRPSTAKGSADGGRRPARPRDDRPRDDRPRDDRPRDDRPRPASRDDDWGPGVYRVARGGEAERVERTRRPGPPPR